MDPPTAIRTKKLVLTRMLTEDSVIFDPYLVYKNFVVDPSIANYKYSFPLAAFKASTICPYTYI